MGVEFYVCKRCGDTFPDCGSYVNCNDCYSHWCSDECAEGDGWRVDIEETSGDGTEGSYGEEAAHSCNYCRCEAADNHTLFSFLLTKLDLTRDEVLQQWRAQLNLPDYQKAK